MRGRMYAKDRIDYSFCGESCQLPDWGKKGVDKRGNTCYNTQALRKCVLNIAE